ncbi:MAG: hypothetical protein ACYDHW_01160 [Syntrophorhabdaceae bacterium]
MPEIAYTTIGRNSLFLGLISHIAAILVAMMPSGAAQFFTVVFPISCLFLIVAVHTELKHRGSHPFKQWLFYAAAAATIFPLIGPALVLAFLYSFQESKSSIGRKIFGFIWAVFRLKANMLLGFALILILLVLFFFTTSRSERYHKNKSLRESSFIIANQEEITLNKYVCI